MSRSVRKLPTALRSAAACRALSGQTARRQAGRLPTHQRPARAACCAVKFQVRVTFSSTEVEILRLVQFLPCFLISQRSTRALLHQRRARMAARASCSRTPRHSASAPTVSRASTAREVRSAQFARKKIEFERVVRFAEADACASQPCHNGGRCVKLGVGKIRCDCAQGFAGHDCSLAGVVAVCYQVHQRAAFCSAESDRKSTRLNSSHT